MNAKSILILMLTGLCLFFAAGASAATVFFEDFNTGGDLGDRLFTQGDGTVAITTGTELLEVSAFGLDAAGVWTSYSIEYPGSGSISWDTTQNRYVQAWIPYNSDSDLPALFVQVDGGEWTNTWWDVHGLNDPSMNTRPPVLDLNTMAGLSAGTHQLRFRLVFGNTPYAWLPADTDTMYLSWDWFKGGMSPTAQTTVGACTFVGPADDALTDNPPTLSWTAPAGFPGGTYSVSYSQDRFFRGPTTVTVHNIATTQYTPPQELAQGKWYWTVIPVNSDDISGYCMPKGIGNEISNGDWRAPYDYQFYSFRTPGVNGAKQWATFE